MWQRLLQCYRSSHIAQGGPTRRLPHNAFYTCIAQGFWPSKHTGHQISLSALVMLHSLIIPMTVNAVKGISCNYPGCLSIGRQEDRIQSRHYAARVGACTICNRYDSYYASIHKRSIRSIAGSHILIERLDAKASPPGNHRASTV